MTDKLLVDIGEAHDGISKLLNSRDHADDLISTLQRNG